MAARDRSRAGLPSGRRSGRRASGRTHFRKIVGRRKRLRGTRSTESPQADPWRQSTDAGGTGRPPRPSERSASRSCMELTRDRSGVGRKQGEIEVASLSLQVLALLGEPPPLEALAAVHLPVARDRFRVRDLGGVGHDVIAEQRNDRAPSSRVMLCISRYMSRRLASSTSALAAFRSWLNLSCFQWVAFQAASAA